MMMRKAVAFATGEQIVVAGRVGSYRTMYRLRGFYGLTLPSAPCPDAIMPRQRIKAQSPVFIADKGDKASGMPVSR